MAGYGDDNAFNAWLAESGYELPGGAPTPAVLRHRGSAYIDAVYGPRFGGQPTGGLAQPLAWPRTGAYAFGSEIPDTTIPNQVITASYMAALQEANEPGSLSALVIASAQVRRERVGSLETEYFDRDGDAVTSSTPILTSVEGLLRPLFATPELGFIVV